MYAPRAQLLLRTMKVYNARARRFCMYLVRKYRYSFVTYDNRLLRIIRIFYDYSVNEDGVGHKIHIYTIFASLGSQLIKVVHEKRRLNGGNNV